MPEIIFRTLRHEYRLVCPDQETTEAMAFMEIMPDMPGFALEVVKIPIEVDQGYFRIRDRSGDMVEGSKLHIFNWLHALIYSDILEGEASCPILHCGTMINPNNPAGRIAVLGRKGQGKTTLMLSLLTQGFQIEGDEHLVLREHEVVARPRTFRVKTGSLNLVPDLAGVFKDLPSVPTWDGNRIYAFNPKNISLPWTISPGTLDHVVILEANHGGRSVIHGIETEQALKRAVEQAVLPNQGKGAAFARLRAKILTAGCHCLRIGELEQTGDLIRRQIAQQA